MVLSISGGVDSMVLLSLVTHPDCIVVHFNHGLRENASSDERFVVQEAKKRAFRYEVIPLQLDPNDNMQDNARNLRYLHLANIAKKYNIDEVALGHQGDDLIESMLLHLVRGTSLKGLQMRSSFTLHDITFSRPLLEISKNEILSYAATHQIAFVEDDSNRSDAYLRNRLRHHVIPLLAQEQPQLLDKFTQLSQQVHQLLPLLDQLTEEVFIAPSRALYRQLEPVLQRYVLSRWLDELQISPHQALLDQMHDVLASTTPHLDVRLSKELRLQTSYDTVRFVTNVTTLDFMQKINAPGTYEGPNHDIVIVTTEMDESAYNPATICFESPNIFPLELRYRKAGDIVHLTGGRKKLKDWLIDLKVDRQERDLLLVLAKDQHIYWIPALDYTSSQSGQYRIYCSWRPLQ